MTQVIAQLSINVRSQYSSGINGFKLKPCYLLEECWQTSMTKAACPHRLYHLLPLQWAQQQEFLSVPLLQVSPSRSQCSYLDFLSKWSLGKVKIIQQRRLNCGINLINSVVNGNNAEQADELATKFIQYCSVRSYGFFPLATQTPTSLSGSVSSAYISISRVHLLLQQG